MMSSPAAAVFDPASITSPITSEQIQSTHFGVLAKALTLSEAIGIATDIQRGAYSLDAYINSLVEQAGATTLPAIISSAVFTGKTPTKAHLDELAAFSQAQFDAYQQKGSTNPQLGVYEAAGLGFSETVVFRDTFGSMPTATFSASAYATVFGRAPTADQAAHFDAQRTYFLNLYKGAGETEALAELHAKGAVVGQMIGVAVLDEPQLHAFVGQATDFLRKAAIGQANYGGPLGGEVPVDSGSSGSASNSPPVVRNFDLQPVNEDTPVVITQASLLVGATDPEGGPLTASLSLASGLGSLVNNADGTWTYTPARDDDTGASFTYTVTDRQNAPVSAVARLDITPVNDNPIAAADSYTIANNATLTVAAPGILTNDTDVEGDALGAVLVTGPAHGTLTFGANGSFSYSPNSGFIGPDSFTYRASDGTGQSAPTAVNLAVTTALPIATNDTLKVSVNSAFTIRVADLLANDTDADGGTLALQSINTSGLKGTLINNNDGTLTYDPTGAFALTLGQSETTTFSYTLADGQGGTDVGTVSLDVSSKLANFANSKINYDHLFPDANTANSSRNFDVGSGVQFAYRAGSGVSAFVEVKGSQIIMSTTAASIGFSQPGGATGFHGFRVDDYLDQIGDITGVSVNSTSIAIDPSRIAFNADSVTFSIGNLSLGINDRIILDVFFI